MKSRTLFISIALVVLFSLSNIFAQADSKEDYNIVNTSKITVKGTSTLHDWKAEAKVIKGNLTVIKGNDDANAIANLGDLSGMKVVVPVKELKSGESGMDDKMDDALKADDNPNITYTLNKVDSLIYKDSSKQAFTINTYGTLNVAGKSKNIEMKVNGKIDGNNIVFTGEKKLLMTDFGVDPPTAFFGVMKSGNQITIVYNVVLAKK